MSGKIPIALQLHAVRGECAKDLPATLKGVADAGYVGAEPWGYDGTVLEWRGIAAKDLRSLYDDNGLTCCGFHVSTSSLMGDRLARTIEMNQILGNNFLIISSDKDRMAKLDTIMELAGILDAAAEKLGPLGMSAGYHAHGFDFAEIEGSTGWEILFGNTRDEVIMQLDIGNCATGGGDPIAMLKKFPGRARSVHLRDYGGAPGSAIGEGEADWETILSLCETDHHPAWYVIEQGGVDGIGFDVPRRSLEALRAMGR